MNFENLKVYMVNLLKKIMKKNMITCLNFENFIIIKSKIIKKSLIEIFFLK